MYKWLSLSGSPRGASPGEPRGVEFTPGVGRVFSPSHQPSPFQADACHSGALSNVHGFSPHRPCSQQQLCSTVESDTTCLPDLRVPSCSYSKSAVEVSLGFCVQLNQGDAARECQFYVSIVPGQGVSQYLVKHDYGCVFTGVSGSVSIWICRLSETDCPAQCRWASSHQLKAE